MMNKGFLYYTLYAAVVGLLTLAELLTAGHYRKWFILFGVSYGFGIGLGLESSWTMVEKRMLSIREISRALLYIVPIAFCDSILLFINGLIIKSNELIFAGVYMMSIQIGMLLYLFNRVRASNALL